MGHQFSTQIYPGLFNSSYQPNPIELEFIHAPYNELGPALLGQMFLTVLQGVLFVQYYEYLCYFAHDKRWTKWLVHAASILCTIKFLYMTWATWDKFVPHFGDWSYVTSFTGLTVPIGISTTIPSAVCQVFYIHRYWALSHNWFFLILAVLSLIITVGGGIALTVGASLSAEGLFQGFFVIVPAVNITLASALVCDLFITSFTCYYLLRKKSDFSQSDNLAFRLTKLSIESAAGPTTVALANLILNNMSSNNAWFLLPNIALSHVYGCSLLYTVNARRKVRVTLTGVPEASLSPQMLKQRGGAQSEGLSADPQGSRWRVLSGRDQEAYRFGTRSVPSVLVEVETIHFINEPFNMAEQQRKLGIKGAKSPNGTSGSSSPVSPTIGVAY